LLLALLVIMTAPVAAQEPCPGAVRLDIDGPSTDIDPGWTGMAHDGHYVGLTLTLGISGCAGSMQPSCGSCALSGPVANGGGATFNNKRCSDKTWLLCDTTADCTSQGAAGPCRVFFGPPLPYAAGGVSVCVTNEITGAASGTIGVESGDIAMSLPYLAKIYSGPLLDDPCPKCVAGSCSGGARNGSPCTVNGTSPLFADDVSFDCPPLAATLIGNLVPAGIPLSTGTTSMTLSAASPNCRAAGFTALKCLCDTCNNLSATACASNADCTAVGATVCGGKRCIGGVNSGAPCAATSECPGGGCAIPGAFPAPNQCDDGTCSPNPGDTDSSDEGQCSVGPFEQFCAMQTYRGCATNADCPAPGDSCTVGKFRECFTDNGLLGGSISAAGVADPPVNSTAAPTLAGVTCIPPTTSSSVNVVAGFPGAGRLTLPSISTLADEIADGTVPAGGTVTTDTEADGATPSDPLETTVTSPNAGEIILEEQAATGTPPGGFTFLGKQVDITAPPATPSVPLTLVFRIDASRIIPPDTAGTIVVFKNGVPIADCPGSSVASPDPCISDRATLGDGDVQLTVLTSSASQWNFGSVQSICPPAPDGSCRQPFVAQKASVQLKDNADDAKDQLVWKWVKGAATSMGDFDDPTSTDAYELCVYDGSGLLTSVKAPAGGMCGTKPCWAAKTTSFKYKNKAQLGQAQVLLKSGVDGKAKILVKAKGATFLMPNLGTLQSPMTVQLRHTANAICWGAQYSFPPATKNDGVTFKDKAD